MKNKPRLTRVIMDRNKGAGCDGCFYHDNGCKFPGEATGCVGIGLISGGYYMVYKEVKEPIVIPVPHMQTENVCEGCIYERESTVANACKERMKICSPSKDSKTWKIFIRDYS